MLLIHNRIDHIYPILYPFSMKRWDTKFNILLPTYLFNWSLTWSTKCMIPLRVFLVSIYFFFCRIFNFSTYLLHYFIDDDDRLELDKNDPGVEFYNYLFFYFKFYSLLIELKFFYILFRYILTFCNFINFFLSSNQHFFSLCKII